MVLSSVSGNGKSRSACEQAVVARSRPDKMCVPRARVRGVAEGIEIQETERDAARAIAEIHLAARREAMPYLRRPHTDDETRDWFARIVGDRRAAWWVAQTGREVVAYMLIDGENLDHLHVRPGWQRRGVGLSLLNKASQTYLKFPDQTAWVSLSVG
jgi:GNAT superfamily N-acetyltransferase